MISIPQIIKAPFYGIYERRLARQAKEWTLPHHIGIILDGNRRFARMLGLNTDKGHERGADKLGDVLTWCYDFGIPVITIWGLGMDNFDRDEDEVRGLLALIERKTREMKTSDAVHSRQVKIQFIGRREILPESLQEAIAELEQVTDKYTGSKLNVAIAYGGREEITDAVKRYLTSRSQNGHTLEEILEELAPEAIDDFLYTAGQPDPDLIIRTSGEVRLSGFLLWQSAYSEYYFCDTFWPAFRRIDFLRALREYSQRSRRFGR